MGFWRFFRDCAYGIVFCIAGGGRPRVRSKFPPNNPKKSNLNWAHGFHRALEVFWNIAYVFVLAFLEGGGPGYLANFLRLVQNNPICIGYMDFMRVWKLFLDFAYEIAFFSFLEEGGPRYLANFLRQI